MILRRTGRWKRIALICLVCALAASYLSWRAWLAFEQKRFTQYLDSPIPLSSTTKVTVNAGSTLRQAVNSLALAGIIEDEPFVGAVLRLGYERKVQAGHYQVNAGISHRQLIDKLITGDVSNEKFPLIEGTTFKTVLANLAKLERLKKTLIGLPFQDVWAIITPDSPYGPEGMLMPDTYLYSSAVSDTDILRKSHLRLLDLLETEWTQRAPDLPYDDPYQALIMASIIEKETGFAGERKLVASVFINRLRKGMRLQSDPTVIYGMGDAFDGNLRKADLTNDTPYNTYTRKGLPPTPIAMVSEASLRAALHPDDSDFLYFVADGSGGHKFSKTLREHINAVNRYQKKRK